MDSPLQSAAPIKSIHVLKLLFQSVIYHIWRERKSRIFTAVDSPVATLRLTIDRAMRSRLLSFPGSSAQPLSLLQVYFRSLSFPL
ncbi:unnamed protein product [Arabidopsis halleri]